VKIVPVETLSQVEHMRLIYNENLAELSTRPLPERTYEEQVAWWNGLDRQKVKAWLHYDEPYRLIGFSMLTHRDGFATPMFAIRKAEQGQGYGWSFIRHYIEKAGSPLAGAQLQSNKAICHMNEKLGWEIIKSKDGVDYLFNNANTERWSTRMMIGTFDQVMKYFEERMNAT
jgi:GNAT superfamily N-acetyltransferase